MYDFIELFAPHLTRDRVRNAMNSPNKEQLERLFAGLVLPRL
jgi:LysR family cys regulon transcriptional activator